MIEIRFEEHSDARKMYEHVTAEARGDLIARLDGQTVQLAYACEEEAYIAEQFIAAFIQFILQVKEDRWIVAILEQSFFYHDHEEQHQILHIAHSLLAGNRRDVPAKGLVAEREELLRESLKEFVRSPLSFSFESYVRFRLKDYMSYLFRLTELAIDEYKLEQEYQEFVEMLRQHVGGRKPRLSCLHLVYNGSFKFYDERGVRLHQERLVQYMDETIRYQQGSYIDTNVIAPLLSIAPRTIYLYTAQTDHNMIITIRNVFQERVIVQTIGDFEKIRCT